MPKGPLRASCLTDVIVGVTGCAGLGMRGSCPGSSCRATLWVGISESRSTFCPNLPQRVLSVTKYIAPRGSSGVMADGAISEATEFGHSVGQPSAKTWRQIVRPGLLPGMCHWTCRAFSFLCTLERGRGGKEERAFGGRDIIGCPSTEQQRRETCSVHPRVTVIPVT